MNNEIRLEEYFPWRREDRGVIRIGFKHKDKGCRQMFPYFIEESIKENKFEV